MSTYPPPVSKWCHGGRLCGGAGKKNGEKGRGRVRGGGEGGWERRGRERKIGRKRWKHMADAERTEMTSGGVGE